MIVESLVDIECQLGEGPLWDERNQRVLWVDILRSRLHQSKADGRDHLSRSFPDGITSISATDDGRFLITTLKEFALLDSFAGSLTTLGGPESDLPNNRFNDAKAGAAGELWAGTMDDQEETATGSLYRFRISEGWQKMDSGYVCTNGPALSPDGSTLYHTDTFANTIYRFDLSANGQLAEKMPFIVNNGAGFPDGMTVDARGNLYVCFWGGSRIEKYSPRGELLDTFDLPTVNVTSATFGGKDYDTLFVTSAAVGLTIEQQRAQPLAGHLFALRVGETGLAPARVEVNQANSILQQVGS
ncbi:MAG: SMP-30/gluconolactonase/LRE family protein [Pseudomonadota bacterium]